MQVIRASTAGFCMGVSLALEKLEQAIKTSQDNPEARICTLGPIIHNPQVLSSFERQGVCCLNIASEAGARDHVIIRAHGITRDEEATLCEKCRKVVDATCPKVKKAQLAIAKATRKGATLLLFGEAAHPEVRGLVSYAQNGAHVFGSLEELEQIELRPDMPHVLASQTTQDKKTFACISAWLSDRLPELSILSTICDATRQRQEEALEIARKVDVMVVIGGRESGNTRRLASLACQAGVETYHVETPEELLLQNFRQKARAGLTAGASTPKSLIDAAERWLKNVPGDES